MIKNLLPSFMFDFIFINPKGTPFPSHCRVVTPSLTWSISWNLSEVDVQNRQWI